MNNDLVKILLIVLAGGVLLYLLNNNQQIDTFESLEQHATKPGLAQKVEQEIKKEVDKVEGNNDNNNNNGNVKAAEALGTNEVYGDADEVESNNFNLGKNNLPKDCFPKDQLSPSELLPGDANSKWSQVNPSGQGELGDQNFLSAGYHIGVNTVGQSLRNANLQLRSEPPNPQVKVSPWMQSTIEPDINRKPLEIGGCQ
tara:strand:- start:608 stop:1204 length:597 start_codon:yes stop_codon:yes gene_type:complete